MLRQPAWYRAEPNDQCFDPAKEAFEEGKNVFSVEMSKDNRKQGLVQQMTCLEDIKTLVTSAKGRYSVAPKSRKAREWLHKLSQRVQYYGSFMDIMVKQHPEYVSLAWGAMKIVFVLVENHEKLVAKLAKAMASIGDSLARVGLALSLYPTVRMRHAVAKVYACVIRFYIRAYNWYKASRLHHVWDSLARPVELRYDDLIENVDSSIGEVESLATVAARAEQRDVHVEILNLGRRMADSGNLLLEIRHLVSSQHSILSSMRMMPTISSSLEQCSSLLADIFTTTKNNVAKDLRYTTLLVKHGRNKASWTPFPVWEDQRFEKWKSAADSGVVVIRGDYGSRFQLQNTGIHIINVLKENRVPVIWILKSPDNTPTIIDIVRGLVYQALQLWDSHQTKNSMAHIHARLQEVEEEGEWFDLLSSVIAELRQVYIILDLGAAPENAMFWVSSFEQLFSTSYEGSSQTVMKVLLIGYGPTTELLADRPELAKITINIKRINHRINIRQMRPRPLRTRLVSRHKEAAPLNCNEE